MQQPSKNWKNIRRAVLARAQRTVVEPLSPLYDIYLGVVALYLAGFLHFNFVDDSSGFTWLTACFLIGVAVAGALIPVLTGAVLTLHFASKRMERLITD